MMYPLVREVAVDGIPVTVTCRVVKIARQRSYRWLADPVSDTTRIEAQRANALWKKQLAEYEAPPLDPAIDEALLDFMQRRKASFPDSNY